MPDARPVVDLQDGLPPWLAAFVLEAQHESDTLRANGAEQAAVARLALLRKLVVAAQTFLDTELDATEAAEESGRCEGAIRPAVRAGTIPGRQGNPKCRSRLRPRC